MCGIVGFIGNENVKPILLSGLKQLEYRGYDSSGISILTNEKKLLTFKDKGRINHLETIIDDSFATIGIGHTRWATHGIVNYLNSHPHVTKNNRFSIVHNGVIENEDELRKKYFENFVFKSETDTEVIAELLNILYDKYHLLTKAIEEFLKIVKGSYAVVVIDASDPSRLYAIKNKSPLIIGSAIHFTMIASDVSAMTFKTNRFINMSDLEYAILERGHFSLFDGYGNIVHRDAYSVDINENDSDIGLYKHYMLKEIEEQPIVIRRIMDKYQQDHHFFVNEEIVSLIKNAERIYIIAAGTSYHAGLIAKRIFESFLKKEVTVMIASEFNYEILIFSKKPLFIFISQSGETADSRQALNEVNRLGFKSIAITNVINSTLSREATFHLYMHAGREIAVASTKAYTASITVLLILAYLSSDESFDLYYELSKAVNVISNIIDQKEIIQQLTKSYLTDKNRCFFIGRLMDYDIALEGALKLKEISYIQSEGFAAGELKHGTIALIEKDTPVIVINSQPKTTLNTRANAKETEARGAKTLYISFKSLSKENDQIIIDDIMPILASLVVIVPLQLIAYFAALDRGLDIDKPRNLAKSVTVE